MKRRFYNTLRFLAVAVALSLLKGGVFCLSAIAEPQLPAELVNKNLQQVKKNIVLSQQKISQLTEKVSNLKEDQEILERSLIDTAALERQTSEKIVTENHRLSFLVKRKLQLEQKLLGQRKELAQILAAIERVGLKPPPALLVTPDDAAVSLRSAVLLGMLLTKMQKKTEAVKAVLNSVTQVQNRILQEKDKLTKELQAQLQQRQKIQRLIEEKRQFCGQSEAELVQERKENERLAAKAESLEALLQKLDEKMLNNPKEKAAFAAAQRRLAQSAPFADLQHQLALPVGGAIARVFAPQKSDPLKGELLITAPKALVTAPANAVVVYSGIFRSYGELVILDVGSGYYILLAGLVHSNVERGQFVSKGEPIGMMATKCIAPVLAIELKTTKPVLYIALRKAGKALNPSDWWAQNDNKRNKNAL